MPLITYTLQPHWLDRLEVEYLISFDIIHRPFRAAILNKSFTIANISTRKPHSKVILFFLFFRLIPTISISFCIIECKARRENSRTRDILVESLLGKSGIAVYVPVMAHSSKCTHRCQ